MVRKGGDYLFNELLWGKSNETSLGAVRRASPEEFKGKVRFEKGGEGTLLLVFSLNIDNEMREGRGYGVVISARQSYLWLVGTPAGQCTRWIRTHILLSPYERWKAPGIAPSFMRSPFIGEGR